LTSFSSFRVVFALAVVSALGAAGLAACSSTTTETAPALPSDGGTRRDADPVDPLDGGDAAADSGAVLTPPSCMKYCESVQENCKGEHAQYATLYDCMTFCAHLPPGDPLDKEKEASLACRQYYAGTPAKAQPEAYCVAAGPYGGGICGDRCTGFCQITLSTCAPDAGYAPYASLPDCKTACAEYTFKDAGVDGGGEGLDGPSSGDTLNCRLHLLREIVLDGGPPCEALGADAGPCN
jgi:hypothetical protein